MTLQLALLGWLSPNRIPAVVGWDVIRLWWGSHPDPYEGSRGLSLLVEGGRESVEPSWPHFHWIWGRRKGGVGGEMYIVCTYVVVKLDGLQSQLHPVSP